MKKFNLFKLLCVGFLTFSLTATPTISIPKSPVMIEAASKVKLSSSSKTLFIGDTFNLTLKNTGSTVTWTTSKGSIATVTSTGTNTASITALKKGTTTIKAKINKKTYTCKITVKKGTGTRKNPYSGSVTKTYDVWAPVSMNSEKVQLVLTKYLKGDSALARVQQEDPSVEEPSSNTQWIFMTFRLKYIDGIDSITKSDLISIESFYNESATQSIPVYSGYIFEGSSLLDTSLYPGGSVTFSYAVLTSKKLNNLTYRVPKSINMETSSIDYLWFTTK